MVDNHTDGTRHSPLGPVHGVGQGGAHWTGIGQLSISGLGDKKGDAKTIFFVIPGVQEWLFVDPSLGRFKKQAKLGGGISAIA
jgi:hypothetical protein